MSRHRNLEELQKYLEVRPEQARGAVSALLMLSYAGKITYDDVETNFLEPPQVDDWEASDNGGIYL